MTDIHQKCRFSVVCQTNDLAVVHCLRALCYFAEQDPDGKKVGFGGTGVQEWLNDGKEMTLRFTDPAYRDKFEQEAKRLLPAGTWTVADRSNYDPAKPQR